MNNLKDRSLKCSFNGHKCLNSEVMGSTHPLTDFSFFLIKKHCQVFLLQTFLGQNFVDSIHYLERQVYRLPNLWIYPSSTILQNITSLHNV